MTYLELMNVQTISSKSSPFFLSVRGFDEQDNTWINTQYFIFPISDKL